MSTMVGKDWDRAREPVEAAVDEVAVKILAAGVNPGFSAALVIAGTNLVNEHDGPDRAVDLLEGIIETLKDPPKRPIPHVAGGHFRHRKPASRAG